MAARVVRGPGGHAGGAVAGGFAVGIIENLAGTFIPYVGRELKLTILSSSAFRLTREHGIRL